MANNDIRTKINELPICEDMNLVDTLIAIGTDGKTYRVNKDNVAGGGGGEWTPLTAVITSSNTDSNEYTINVNLVESELNEVLSTEGKIHTIVCNTEAGSYHDIEFFISPSYAPPVETGGANIEKTELGRNFAYIYLSNAGIKAIFGMLYTDSLVLAGTDMITNSPVNFEFKGIFFEPIKNVGDLSKVSAANPS